MKEPIFQFNDRVEFKDSENIFHIGFVKKIKRQRNVWFRHEWVYDICEYVKDAALRKVYVVPEDNIFGVVEAKTHKKGEAPIIVKGHKAHKSIGEMKELINNNE